MGMQSGSLDYWRKFFRTANSDILEVIEHAILVAASDCPKELKMRRDRIAEKLYSSSACDCVELPVPEKNEEEEEDDEGFKSDDFEGTGKESKVNSSISDHLEMDINRGSNYSYDEAEALTDEIEEESQTIGEVLRIKEILSNFQDESDGTLFESLRRLQLMELSVEILQATEIGKPVNKLRKHASKQIRNLVRILIDGWKHIVDEWVKTTATPALTEGSPDSVKPSIDDDGDEEGEEGLPSPPLENGAFLATQTGPMELSQFFDGMDDDGNLQNNGGSSKNPENRRKSLQSNHKFSKENNGGQPMKKQETVIKQSRPFKADSESGRPLKPSSEYKINNEIKSLKNPDQHGMMKRPMAFQKDKSNCSDEVSVQVKLEATKRKLLQGYQQAENAKKQRTIQVMELHDLPKQGLGHKNPHVKNGNHLRHWANGRR